MKFGMFLIGDNSPDQNRNKAPRPLGRGALLFCGGNYVVPDSPKGYQTPWGVDG